MNKNNNPCNRLAADSEHPLNGTHRFPVAVPLSDWLHLRMTIMMISTTHDQPPTPRPGPISPDQKKNQKRICLSALSVGNPCRSVDAEDSYMLFQYDRSCFDYYREGKQSSSNVQGKGLLARLAQQGFSKVCYCLCS